jgi:creatinine amidohydrolase
MLLALTPELVDVEAANTVEAPAGGLFDQGGVHVWRSTSYWTPTGVIGAPHAATAEKGEALLEAAATAIAQRLAAGDIWDSKAATAV